ncbi:unnamed protein product [Heligmosomoides polygyrus]|uniref:Tyrosine-protein phosphatase domain-containing protein n=1 Tax=Heligmosomoides polygyrus TaxID=6339 RepID=A0A183G248_HELPZ|nr:unnamed protein product [Heligmosomoides polygyrus]
MLGVRSCGKRKSKALSSADISFPFDFRIETHIEAESTVTQVISFVNNATLTHRNRPNLLAPNPNWPTVGQRQRLSRGPLTEEELERSPFGKYLIDLRQPSDARLFPTYGSNQTDPTPLGGDAGTVPTTPIPRAPTRYRNRLPSPWMNNGPHGIA